jgi:hypothetical protein
VQYTCNGGCHHGGQRTAEHRPQAEFRDIRFTLGRQPADTTDLNGDG